MAIKRKTPGTVSKVLLPKTTGITNPQSTSSKASQTKRTVKLPAITGQAARGPVLPDRTVTPQSYSTFQKDIQLEEMFGQYGSLIAPKIRAEAQQTSKSIPKIIAETNKKLGIRQVKTGKGAFEYDKNIYDIEGNLINLKSTIQPLTNVDLSVPSQTTISKVDTTKASSYFYSQNRSQKAIIDLGVAIRQGRQAALRYPSELKPLIPIGISFSIKR